MIIFDHLISEFGPVVARATRTVIVSPTDSQGFTDRVELAAKTLSDSLDDSRRQAGESFRVAAVAMRRHHLTFDGDHRTRLVATARQHLSQAAARLQ